MFQALFSVVESVLSHPEFLVPTMWVALGCTIAWYLLSAKRWHAISRTELQMLWKTHKQFTRCTSEGFEPIRKGKKIVGYKCQCGHEHIQEKPLINFGA